MLALCYLVHGGEPLQTEEYISKIKQLASKEDYNSYRVFEINAQFDWEELLNTCRNLDLFAERSVVELRLQGDSISKQGTQTLEYILQNQPTDLCIVIRAGKLKPQSLNSTWVSLVQNKGTVYLAKSIAANKWTAWLRTRLQQANFAPTAEVVEYLANYYEGNLPAASQCVQKLQAALPAGALSLDKLEPFIARDTHFTVFDLSDAAIKGDTDRTFNIFQSLKNEGFDPLLILWAITRELRNLLELSNAIHTGADLSQSAQKLGIWRERIPSIKLTLDRLSATNLQSLLKICKSIDTKLKGITPGNAWEPLLAVYLTLASGKILTMEELNI